MNCLEDDELKHKVLGLRLKMVEKLKLDLFQWESVVVRKCFLFVRW